MSAKQQRPALADSTNKVATPDESAPAFCEKISLEEYERQKAEYTRKMIEQLNVAVKENPAIGAKSNFFSKSENVKNGLPIFEGRHTRFVYDDEDNIVGAEEVEGEDLDDIVGPTVEVQEEEPEEGFEEEEEELEEEEEEDLSDLEEDNAELEDSAVHALAKAVQNTHIHFIDEDDE